MSCTTSARRAPTPRAPRRGPGRADGRSPPAPHAGPGRRRPARPAGPVERAVGAEHLRPELGDDGGQARRTGRHDLAGERVGVDHDHPQVAQHRGHGALARGDATGQSHSHGLIVSSPDGAGLRQCRRSTLVQTAYSCLGFTNQPDVNTPWPGSRTFTTPRRASPCFESTGTRLSVAAIGGTALAVSMLGRAEPGRHQRRSRARLGVLPALGESTDLTPGYLRRPSSQRYGARPRPSGRPWSPAPRPTRPTTAPSAPRPSSTSTR